MGLLAKLFGPPSREEFSRIVTRQLRERGESRPIQFDPERFCLRLGDNAHTMFLQNAYVEYCRTPRARRTDVLQRAASTVELGRRPEPALDEVRSNLLPRVRERVYFSSFDLNTRIERLIRPPETNADKPPLENFIIQPFAEQLTLEIVIDTPTAIQSLSRKLVEKWGVSFDELLPIAKDNLWRMSNQDFPQVAPGVYLSPWRDTHDASRLFLHDLIWQLKVKGDHVAAVPNRDILLVTGSEDVDGLKAMAALAEEALKQPRPMTGTFFRLSGTQWSPFLPSPDSPAYWPVKGLAMRVIANDYAEQTSLLTTLHEKSKQDVFVAKQALMRRDDGSFWTWAVWVDGVDDALLPKADFISFGAVENGQKRQDGWAPWSSVVSVLGHRMEATDVYPPRFRVRTYPTVDERAALQLMKEPT